MRYLLNYELIKSTRGPRSQLGRNSPLELTLCVCEVQRTRRGKLLPLLLTTRLTWMGRGGKKNRPVPQFPPVRNGFAARGGDGAEVEEGVC